MASDAEVLELVQTAFADCPRPDHFFADLDDPEWRDQDETLRSHSVDTIGEAELGNPGYDPICSANTEGYLYYMPALARLALNKSNDSYVTQFLFHLTAERMAAFTMAQRGAVARLLEHLRDTRGAELEFDREELVDRIRRLQAGTD